MQPENMYYFIWILEFILLIEQSQYMDMQVV